MSRPTKKAPEHLVELTTTSTDTLHLTSTYTGSLRARRSIRVHVREEGGVAHVPHYEGDAVAAGDVLVAIDDTLLTAQLARAMALVGETEANAERLKGLRARKLVGEDEFLRATTAVQVARAEAAVLRTRIGFTVVSAPFDGVVTERRVEPGDVVARHDHVLTLIDPDSLVIDINASELIIPNLAPGDAVSFRIDALGPRDFTGKVLRIHPELDQRTRQGRVEVALTPIPPGARAGQFARVTFTVDALGRSVVDFGALRRDRDGEYVFVLNADSTVRRVGVRSGRRLAHRVEILEGLDAGDRVVLRGFLGLTDGKTVTDAATRGQGTR